MDRGVNRSRFLGRGLVALVLAHEGVHVAHGLLHSLVPVPTTGWQLAFVLGIVFLAPIVGLLLVHRGRRRTGGWALAVAGVATLVFEVAFHFVVASPDHVGHVTGPWSGGFVATAVIGVSLAGLMGIAGLWVVRVERVAAAQPEG